MTQTLALFLDAYRELNSKRLFWITISMSGFVVLAFLAMGIDAAGVSICGFHLPFLKDENTSIMSQQEFFLAAFYQLGVNWWLTWIAAILALVSTAGIFPDLIAGGSIDLYLSKPISRLRLFITKYLTGLLFVTLQVGAFVVGSILVLRIRGGVWMPKVFLAVPVILLFFSYLYCICVLLGVVTRSTIAAILLTILFWAVVASVQFIESTSVLSAKIKFEIIATRLEHRIAQEQDHIKTGETITSVWHVDPAKRLQDLLAEQQENDVNVRMMENVSNWFHRTVAVLPKTSATMGLLRRWLIDDSEDKAIARRYNLSGSDDDEPMPLMFGVTSDDLRAAIRAKKIVAERPVSWGIGTSLIFEAVVVSIAAWIFCRRDY